MIVYLSGNFPQLSKIEKERAFKDDLESRDYDYHRLGTFFYPKNLDVIMALKKEENPDASEQSRVAEDTASSETGSGEEGSRGADDSHPVHRFRRRNV